MESTSKVLYMLYDTDDYDMREHGPYWGDPGLDFSELSQQYRADAYSAASAAHEDYCFLSDGDFAAWLLKTGVLVRAECEKVGTSLSSSGGHRYVPAHWPECPLCGDGRGELEYGAARASLNRIATFRRCTECRHEWGHGEQPANSNFPMLEDDGRDTAGGCVPFAISKACGLPFADVLSVCTKHGWHHTGMVPSNAVLAALEMGYDLVRQRSYSVGSGTPPTLKRLLAELPSNRNYVVGVKDHWLAIVGGRIMDNDTNSGPGRKVLELYEVRKVQAVAA